MLQKLPVTLLWLIANLWGRLDNSYNNSILSNLLGNLGYDDKQDASRLLRSHSTPTYGLPEKP